MSVRKRENKCTFNVSFNNWYFDESLLLFFIKDRALPLSYSTSMEDTSMEGSKLDEIFNCKSVSTIRVPLLSSTITLRINLSSLKHKICPNRRGSKSAPLYLMLDMISL
jgi:hypothetical protein